MAIEPINVGTVANDGTGDKLRAAGLKINANFNALAADIADLMELIDNLPGGGAASRWRHGAGAPSGGTGSNGDYYLNVSNGDVYGPKTEGAWGSPIGNLTGPAGASGSVWHRGAGAPSGGTGSNGDFYLNVSNGDVYGPKTEGAWGSPVGNLTGPAGGGGGGSGAWALPAAVSNPSSPYAASGLTGNTVLRFTGVAGHKTINAPGGTFPAGRNWVLHEFTATGGPWTITPGSGITHDGIGVAPTITVPEDGRATMVIYSDDGTNWRIAGDFDFGAHRTQILAALGISVLKARFEIANPAAGIINLLRENVHIGSVLGVLAWTDTGSLTANLQIANKTGTSDWAPTGAASITGLGAVAVTSTPARTAASGANTMERSGTADRILQAELSDFSGSPGLLVLEVEYAL